MTVLQLRRLQRAVGRAVVCRSSANQRSSNSRRNGVAGRLVTKAFEVCDNVVEEIFGLEGLEFEIVMSRVNTEDTVAHQRRRFDRCYFREWDRLEYLLERSLRIEARSFVRQLGNKAQSRHDVGTEGAAQDLKEVEAFPVKQRKSEGVGYAPMDAVTKRNTYTGS